MAGLSAQDSIIAVNGLKLTLAQLEQQILLAEANDTWKIHAFRRDELMEFEMTLAAARNDTVVLLADRPDQQRQAWLSGRADG